jgi:prepilin-type N-terminal cleavage/methylation domain-containing protein
MKKQQGMTIIELIVVLAILAILASVSLPQYLAFQRKAYEAEAKQSLGELRKLAWVYYIENGVFPTLDHLEAWGYWKDPDNAVYDYIGAPPRYIAQPKPGSPVDGMKSWVLVVYADGTAILQ